MLDPHALEWLSAAVVLTAAAVGGGMFIGFRLRARHHELERDGMTAELRRAESDYRGLFENAYDAILILHPFDEVVLDVNHRACVMYDIPREQFIGRSMVSLSVDPARGKALLRRTREGSGRYATFESTQLRGDGSVMEVEINAAEVSYKGKTVILSINRDISARKKAEQTIRENEERFRLLLENVTDYAIVMLDPVGRVVSWNEGAERITGYSESEVLGHTMSLFLPDEDPKLQRATLAGAAHSGSVSYEASYVRKDGTRFSAAVTITRIFDDKGSLRGFAWVTHDITQRLQLDQTRQELVAVLRDVANEWRETFDAVQAPIVLIDEDGEIRRMNVAAQQLAGRTFEQLIHKRPAQLEGEPWSTIGSLAEQTNIRGVSACQRVTEGKSVWEVSTYPAGTAGARRVIVVVHDLTTVTELEATVRRNEMAAAMGALVAAVAHEVRNPLFTISATLDAWGARYGGHDGMTRYGGTLRDQVARLNRLMVDLLEYGKPHPLQVTATSLRDAIRTAASHCELTAEQRGVAIDIEIGDLPPACIDAPRMEQVFQNVIDNAVRHSPSGAVVRVSAVAHMAGITCRVIDEGSGLSAGDIENAFVPFYTRRAGGTGLGLAIARKIVVAHGGEISLAGRDDRSGTVVTIRLPIARAVDCDGAQVQAS